MAKNWYQWIVIVRYSLKQLLGTSLKDKALKPYHKIQWLFGINI